MVAARRKKRTKDKPIPPNLYPRSRPKNTAGSATTAEPTPADPEDSPPLLDRTDTYLPARDHHIASLPPRTPATTRNHLGVLIFGSLPLRCSDARCCPPYDQAAKPAPGKAAPVAGVKRPDPGDGPEGDPTRLKDGEIDERGREARMKRAVERWAEEEVELGTAAPASAPAQEVAAKIMRVGQPAPGEAGLHVPVPARSAPPPLKSILKKGAACGAAGEHGGEPAPEQSAGAAEERATVTDWSRVFPVRADPDLPQTKLPPHRRPKPKPEIVDRQPEVIDPASVLPTLDLSTRLAEEYKALLARSPENILTGARFAVYTLPRLRDPVIIHAVMRHIAPSPTPDEPYYIHGDPYFIWRGELNHPRPTMVEPIGEEWAWRDALLYDIEVLHGAVKAMRTKIVLEHVQHQQLACGVALRTLIQILYEHPIELMRAATLIPAHTLEIYETDPPNPDDTPAAHVYILCSPTLWTYYTRRLAPPTPPRTRFTTVPPTPPVRSLHTHLHLAPDLLACGHLSRTWLPETRPPPAKTLTQISLLAMRAHDHLRTADPLAELQYATPFARTTGLPSNLPSLSRAPTSPLWHRLLRELCAGRTLPPADQALFEMCVAMLPTDAVRAGYEQLLAHDTVPECLQAWLRGVQSGEFARGGARAPGFATATWESAVDAGLLERDWAVRTRGVWKRRVEREVLEVRDGLEGSMCRSVLDHVLSCKKTKRRVWREKCVACGIEYPGGRVMFCLPLAGGAPSRDFKQVPWPVVRDERRSEQADDAGSERASSPGLQPARAVHVKNPEARMLKMFDPTIPVEEKPELLPCNQNLGPKDMVTTKGMYGMDKDGKELRSIGEWLIAKSARVYEEKLRERGVQLSNNKRGKADRKSTRIMFPWDLSGGMKNSAPGMEGEGSTKKEPSAQEPISDPEVKQEDAQGEGEAAINQTTDAQNPEPPEINQDPPSSPPTGADNFTTVMQQLKNVQIKLAGVTELRPDVAVKLARRTAEFKENVAWMELHEEEKDLLRREFDVVEELVTGLAARE